MRVRTTHDLDLVNVFPAWKIVLGVICWITERYQTKRFSVIIAHLVKMSKFEDLEFPYCRDANQIYEKLTKIGQGTFGYAF